MKTQISKPARGKASYTTEYKQEALKLWRSSGRSAAKVASLNIDVCPDLAWCESVDKTKSNSPEEQFASLGWFQLNDAQQLMAALAKEGIDFRAKYNAGQSNFGERGGCGWNSRIAVSVDRDRMSNVEKIKISLFGDCLPNYNSSFFEHELKDETLTENCECLSCRATIPAGSTHCPKCGWTYESS